MADIATCETCPAFDEVCHFRPDGWDTGPDFWCMQHPGNRHLMEPPEPPEPVATVVETPKPVKSASLRDRAFELMARLLQAHGALLHCENCDGQRLAVVANNAHLIAEVIEALAADAWEQSAAGQQEAGQ